MEESIVSPWMDEASHEKWHILKGQKMEIILLIDIVDVMAVQIKSIMAAQCATSKHVCMTWPNEYCYWKPNPKFRERNFHENIINTIPTKASRGEGWWYLCIINCIILHLIRPLNHKYSSIAEGHKVVIPKIPCENVRCVATIYDWLVRLVRWHQKSDVNSSLSRNSRENVRKEARKWNPPIIKRHKRHINPQREIERAASEAGATTQLTDQYKKRISQKSKAPYDA